MDRSLRPSAAFLNRRALLCGASALASLCAFSTGALADEIASAAPQQSGTKFSFDVLTARMRLAAAAEPALPASLPEGFLSTLTYDDYRLIRFNPDRARLGDVENSRFRLHAFHLGWLFKEPVHLFELGGETAAPMDFGTEDFIYEREAAAHAPQGQSLPGVAGFRLHYPLNRPDVLDELIAFQGASYFRALGRGSLYGISARGLAVNTGLGKAEEFPRFTDFWIARPKSGGDTLTIYAALESASLTGAYRFDITPGDETVMRVTARLFFRADIDQLGVAPLTSMYLFGDRNREQFDDFRPRVHDSDGLAITRASGDALWRPLSNPASLASSYFTETAPRSFGLYQRERNFDAYQDAAAHYERRPSVRVEPVGDWGKGVVRLVEIPSDKEVNDNIVAFWVPEKPAKAGDSLEISYRLIWGDLPPDPQAERAYIIASRAGEGGVSGVHNTDGTRKFVIDFAGGTLASLPPEAADQIKPVVSVTRGEVRTQTLFKIPSENLWRLVLDVHANPGATVELSAHLSGWGDTLSEIWAYQWIKP
ncbi:glucan biosynthesis protein G [Thioclava sp. A2]|uniref:glucan biosynthesis protein n=1 Tax=Thioclava sp. FCG-A2 TaxID=3080562 RepID=UPI002952FC93|nr:glucan biosynthesis protein G [Thioclava sp. A2]MDV7271986.1 glucan biosynthesis protein G [Thioclava sp. A2]